jgi:transmembrane sensor
MSQSNLQIREAIAEQAAEWFVENRSGAQDRETGARFMAWLQTSPVHVETYLRTAAVAPDISAAAKRLAIPLEALLARALTDNVRNLDSSQSGPIPVVIRNPRLGTWSLAAAATLVFVAITAIWATRDGERFGLPRTYHSDSGEQIVQALPDGSVLHLNTDSAVTVRYARNERLVTVDRGQALFEVVHGDRRKFRVQAGAAEIIAVGTQFDVYRRSGAVRVTVVEGTVAVYSERLPTVTVHLQAGYQIEVSERVGVPRAVDTRAATAWLERQIVFENESLDQVVAEFNRYGRIPFIIDDDSLRTLLVSGVFEAHDSDSFAAFLATLKGVVVQRTPTRIRVITVATAQRESQPGIR